MIRIAAVDDEIHTLKRFERMVQNYYEFAWSYPKANEYEMMSN